MKTPVRTASITVLVLGSLCGVSGCFVGIGGGGDLEGLHEDVESLRQEVRMLRSSIEEKPAAPKKPATLRERSAAAAQETKTLADEEAARDSK